MIYFSGDTPCLNIQFIFQFSLVGRKLAIGKFLVKQKLISRHSRL